MLFWKIESLASWYVLEKSQPIILKTINSLRKKKANFLYVDRIAINYKYRRFGIGKNLYLKIESIAANNDLPICCEVNTYPLNEISIRFHKDLGFTEVGKCKFKNHSVVYLRK